MDQNFGDQLEEIGQLYILAFSGNHYSNSENV